MKKITYNKIIIEWYEISSAPKTVTLNFSNTPLVKTFLSSLILCNSWVILETRQQAFNNLSDTHIYKLLIQNKDQWGSRI